MQLLRKFRCLAVNIHFCARSAAKIAYLVHFLSKSSALHSSHRKNRLQTLTLKVYLEKKTQEFFKNHLAFQEITKYFASYRTLRKMPAINKNYQSFRSSFEFFSP